MPDQQPDLFSTLLQKADSIGAQEPVTQAMMPLPSEGLMGWLNPGTQYKIGIGGLFDEMKKLAQMQTLGNIKKHLPTIKEYGNKALDYTLGYDPNAKVIGDPVNAGKPKP